MPKLKTHSGAKKRFKLTKTPKRKRGLRQATYADKTNMAAIKLLMPYN